MERAPIAEDKLAKEFKPIQILQMSIFVEMNLWLGCPYACVW